MKVLGLQNKGVSKRLEEYTEEEILQAFQKTSETLSWYKTPQSLSLTKHLLTLCEWFKLSPNIFDDEDVEPSISTILDKLTNNVQVVKVRCRSCRMCMRPTKCSQRYSAPRIKEG